MTDQTRWGIDLVQQRNKAISYDKKNIKNYTRHRIISAK